MMYNYLKLADGTQIAISNPLDDGTIQVTAERPIDGGFDSATCFLPFCEWHDPQGFSAAELDRLSELIASNVPSAETLQVVEDATANRNFCGSFRGVDELTAVLEEDSQL